MNHPQPKDPARDRDRGRRRRRRDRALAGLALATIAAAAALAHTTFSSRPVAAAPPATHSRAAAATTTTPTRDTTALQHTLENLIAASGGSAGVHLQELTGPHPVRLQLDAQTPFTAASTYKLPLLMAQATRPATQTLCYQPEDWEDGPFGDYAEGTCFTRAALMERTGKQSDNTAARILLRDLGGKPALDLYARAQGATSSSFLGPNTTTAADLGRLAAKAPRTIYPLLTETENQSGLPAGVPAGVTVVHKAGWYEDAEADAGIVLLSRNGPYVLAVMTEGVGGEAGWHLIAAIAAAVWAFESA